MHYFEFFHPCLTDKLKTERSCKLCEINCEPIPWWSRQLNINESGTASFVPFLHSILFEYSLLLPLCFNIHGQFFSKKRGKTAYQLLLLGSVEVGVFALVMTFLWNHGLAEIVSLDVCHIFTLWSHLIWYIFAMFVFTFLIYQWSY